MFSSLLLPLAFGATVLSAALPKDTSLWVPPVGAKWQIVLSGNVSVDSGLAPQDADIWDIDLFTHTPQQIQQLKAAGKKVICYFSAGTSENWREDFSSFRPEEMAAGLPQWKGENWLDIRTDNVWSVIRDRIQLAYDKGCDAIDPDNMDGYDNEKGGGFAPPLTAEDSINFVTKMAQEGRKYGMSIGLKNSDAILDRVQDQIQFAVNEQCVTEGECSVYLNFLNSGKPVFHIEYGTASNRSSFCLEGRQGAAMYSTVIKNESQELDGWVYYCDGTETTTSTTGGGKKGGRGARGGRSV